MKKFLLIVILSFILTGPLGAVAIPTLMLIVPLWTVLLSLGAATVPLWLMIGVFSLSSTSSSIIYIHLETPPANVIASIEIESTSNTNGQVAFIVKTVNASGGTFAFVNNTDGDFTYGLYFNLEQKINEVWECVPFIRFDMGFPLFEIQLGSMETHEFYRNWEQIHGVLSDGQYRIVKSIYCRTTPKPSYRAAPIYYLSAEFEIAEEATPQVDFIVRTVTPYGGTFAFVNNSDRTFMYGRHFTLEQKVDGIWERAPFVIENGGFIWESIILPRMQTNEVYINWEWLHGILDSGQYRVVKYIFCTTTPRPRYINAPRYYLFAEFEIYG